MPEDQVVQLPPEVRQMVMTGTNAMMNGASNGGMMGPGVMMDMSGMMPMGIGMPGDMGLGGPMIPMDGAGMIPMHGNTSGPVQGNGIDDASVIPSDPYIPSGPAMSVPTTGQLETV